MEFGCALLFFERGIKITDWRTITVAIYIIIYIVHTSMLVRHSHRYIVISNLDALIHSNIITAVVLSCTF